MRSLRVATVVGDIELEDQVVSDLSVDRQIEVFMRCVDRAELLAVIRARAVDGVAIVGCPSWVDRQCIDEAISGSLTVVGVPRDPLEAEALRALGVGLVAEGPVGDALRAAISRERKDPSFGNSAESKGRIVAVWGPKGSPGRTTVAVELAYAFAGSQPSTLLVDADPYGGDVRQILGILEDVPTIVWAARLAAQHELSAEELLSSVRRTGQGPVVLPGLTRAELWTEVSDYGWRQALDAFRYAAETSILDVGFCFEESVGMRSANDEGRNRITRTSLASADRVIAVLRADAVGIKHFLWAWEDVKTLVDLERVVLVANRVVPAHQRDVEDLVHRYTGKRPILLPFAPADTAEAMSLGRSVAECRPSGAFTRKIEELAAVLGAQVRPRGFLTLLGGRK